MIQAHAPTTSPELPEGAATAVALLYEACENAQRAGRDEREFAVELQHLLAAGVMSGAIRWLLARGYAEQLIETTPQSAENRSFRAVRNLALGTRSCFILTPAGTALRMGATRPNDRPVWDQNRRELRFGREVVKRFAQRASVQETILAAFEEEEWPEHIDDPLPPLPDQDAPSRLRSAVNNLNRPRRPSPIRFGVCHLGTAVFWRTVRPSEAEPKSE